MRSRNEDRKTVFRCDMQFEDDAVLGLAPQSWRTTVYHPDGRIRSEHSNHVTKFAINTEIADSTFTFELPSGTVARNLITDEHYIVQKNGQKRPIEADEGVNLEQYPILLASAPSVHHSSTFRWLILVNALVAVFVVLYVVRRRVTSRTRSITNLVGK